MVVADFESQERYFKKLDTSRENEVGLNGCC